MVSSLEDKTTVELLRTLEHPFLTDLQGYKRQTPVQHACCVTLNCPLFLWERENWPQRVTHGYQINLINLALTIPCALSPLPLQSCGPAQRWTPTIWDRVILQAIGCLNRRLGCQEERNWRRKPVKNSIAQICGPSLQWVWGLEDIKSHQATQRSCCRRRGMEDLRYFRNLYSSRDRGKVHAWACRTEEACAPFIHSLNILWALTMSWSPCSRTEDIYSGRSWVWDDLREQHCNMYITICKTDVQCKFDAWSRVPKAGFWDNPEG